MADDIRPSANAALYDDDFFVWTQTQAEALRAAGEAGKLPPGVDWERLSEEVGDMGRRDLRRAESLVLRIIEHLYLLSASQNPSPRAHWAAEIRAFRRTFLREATATIRTRIEASLAELHEDAADMVNDKLALHELDAPTVDAATRWSLAQILGEEDDPIG